MFACLLYIVFCIPHYGHVTLISTFNHNSFIIFKVISTFPLTTGYIVEFSFRKPTFLDFIRFLCFVCCIPRTFDQRGFGTCSLSNLLNRMLRMYSSKLCPQDYILVGTKIEYNPQDGMFRILVLLVMI